MEVLDLIRRLGDHAPLALPVLVGSVLLVAGVVLVDDAHHPAARAVAWVSGFAGIALNATAFADLLGWTSIWT